MSELLSRRLAHALRHDPASVGLSLDGAGRAPLARVARGLGVTVEALLEVAATGSKPRFAVEGDTIRARHGHTVPGVVPPHIGGVLPSSLWHGTTVEAARAIAREGILPMRRSSVHLSDSVEAALEVAGRRRGGTATVEVLTGPAVEAGASFAQTAPGVWLVALVKPEWIRGAWLA